MQIASTRSHLLQDFVAQTKDDSAASDADGDVCMSTAHAEQDTAQCREDIVSLLEAMHSQLKDQLEQGKVPGFDSFADIALAFGLSSIFMNLLEISLEVGQYK